MSAAKALGVPLLADATIKQLEASRAKLTPEAYRRARHIIEEITRVAKTVKALKSGDLGAVGKLLTDSHQSSRTLFENSTAELDFLVDTLVETKHVHGARLTGGCFGGAVMAVTSCEFGSAQAKRVSAAYTKQFGAAPDVLHAQTGDGAEIVS